MELRILIIVLLAIGYSLVVRVLRILGVWSNVQISRHDLVVASNRRRLEYVDSLIQRQNSTSNVDIVEDEPEQADPPMELADLAPSAEAFEPAQAA